MSALRALLLSAHLKAWRWLHPSRSRLPLDLWWRLAPEIPVVAKTDASLDQRAFRGRNDDGDEANATWIAAENTNWTQGVDEVFRVRIQIDDTASGGENNVQLRLQYNLNSAGWNDVSATSSVVQSGGVSQLVNNDDTTAQLSVPAGATFITPNGGQDDDNGVCGESNQLDFADGTHDYVETEFAVEIVGADVSNGDTIELRTVRDGASLDNWTAMPTVTVSKTAGQTVTIGQAVETDTAQPVSIPPPADRVGFTANNAANASSLILTKPAGTAEDDILVVFLSDEGSGNIHVAPDGSWTQLGQLDGGDGRFSAWWKLAGASEPADYTFSHGSEGDGALDLAGIIVAYRNRDTTTPVDDSSVIAYTADTNPSTSVTPANDNCILVAGLMFDISSGKPPTDETYTADENMVKMHEDFGSGDLLHAAFDQQVGAATTFTRGFTYSSTETNHVIALIAFAPETAGTTELFGSADVSEQVIGTLSQIHSAVGAADSSIQASGALTIIAINELAGSIDVSIETTGNLSETEELAGTVEAQVQATGQLDQAHEPQGAVDASIGVSGALTVVGTNELAGTVQSSIQATGTLEVTGTDELAGSIESRVALSGTLTQTQQLDGSTAISIATSGALTVEGSNELAGTVQSSIDATGALAQTQELGGAADTSISTSGAISVGQLADLQASLALAVGVTGALSQTQQLSQTLAQTLSVVGALKQLQEATAQPRSQIQVSGALTVTQPVTRGSNGVTDALVGSLSLTESLVGSAGVSDASAGNVGVSDS